MNLCVSDVKKDCSSINKCDYWHMFHASITYSFWEKITCVYKLCVVEQWKVKHNKSIHMYITKKKLVDSESR
jgi:hypothetical protein